MFLFLIFCLFTQSTALIYKLNDSEYARMPPIFNFDRYDVCIHQNGIYCTMNIDLIGEDTNNLYNMIREYSERKETHYNHTRLFHGICVSRMCSDYLKENTTEDFKINVERCLNDTYWKNYRLKTRLNENLFCNNEKKERNKTLMFSDIAFALLCLLLIIINIIGTIYDSFVKRNEGNKWLLCFSVKQNWLRLTACSGSGERGTTCLLGFNGMRCITIILVIVQHSLLPFVIAADNTKKMEDSYNTILYHILFDGTVVVQTFFLISGCLLAYYVEIFAEKGNLNWKMIPKGILLRWLRLTPPYFVVLTFIMTWARFTGSGPLWNKAMNLEIEDCRRDGWLNMLYINNYINRTQCMVHTWYLAADMQLTIVGLIILVIARSNRAKVVVLSVIFFISLIIPAIQTYYQNLYAYFTITPEFVVALFRNNPTFNAYRQTHTNISCYVIGLSLGLLINNLKKKKLDLKLYAKYKYLYWALVPIGIGLILINGLFYKDGVDVPLIYKAMYSGAVRAVAGIILFGIMLGMVLGIEDTYRGILEWRGWTTPGRLSYSAYLLHLIVIEILTGTRTTLIHVTEFQIIIVVIGMSVVSFLIAFPFWLLVEGPISQVIKTVYPSSEK